MKELFRKQVEKVKCVIKALLFAVIVCAILSLLLGCKQVEYVTVPEVHEVIRERTDTLRQTDSIISEKETVVMKLDSAAMARYGIQLKSAEQAWLVKTAELERQLKSLEHLTAQKDTVIDSIPKPYPVPEYIEKELSWWQKLRLSIANIVLWVIVIVGGFKIYKLIKK